MSREGNRRRLLTPEERVLWTAVTQSIAPLRSAHAHNDVAAPDVPAEVTPARTPAAPVKSAKQVAPISPPKIAPPPLAPLGRRTRARVARGKDQIDARLDLHGLTQAQAHSALMHFLRNAQARDARLVLVITGKGSKSLGSRTLGARGDGERGVLRRQVPQWLALPEFRAIVLGFEDAHVAHGGEGAIYIRVRRLRSDRE